MLNTRKMRHSLKRISVVPQKITRFISKAVVRIFSPSQDDYPTTVVQPFTGEPADKIY